MIGLVYADYLDPLLQDIFHRTVCNVFQDVAGQFPSEITALTDPDVTNFRLWEVFQKCQFVLYWGHGNNDVNNSPVLLGSKLTEKLLVSHIGSKLTGKQFFLDACSIAKELKNDDFPNVRLIAPVTHSDYDHSVRMGCNLMINIFGRRMRFNDAFRLALGQLERKDLYRMVGTGKTFDALASTNLRDWLSQSFERLLSVWNKKKSPQEDTNIQTSPNGRL